MIISSVGTNGYNYNSGYQQQCNKWIPYVCKPISSQIKFVIFLIVNDAILIILVQIIIPKFLFFFILITYLVDIVLMLYGENLSWSLMGVKELSVRS